VVRRDVPRRGDVYWIDPNPVSGGEMKDRHRFVVITPRQINALGVNMTVSIATGRRICAKGRSRGDGERIRSFDIAARVRAGSASFIGTLDKATIDEIVARVAA